MDLRSTILGLLNWKPLSGYDLKRIISDSDIFYWSGNNNQIYKTLLELEKEDLVSHQVQLQESLPAKKIYSITNKGMVALYQSLLAVPEPPELRKSFLVQLALAESLSDKEIRTLLEKYEEEIAYRLRMYQGQAVRLNNSPARSQREKYLWKRIAENLIESYQTELNWVLQTKQEFSEQKFLDLEP